MQYIKILLILNFLFLFPLVSAAAPLVYNITIIDPINLLEGSTVGVYCNATLSDSDGWGNISTINSTIWHSSSTEGAADDNNDHYTNSSCSLGTNSSATDVPANCRFDMQYYSNSGNWTCKIRANDGSSTGTNETNTTINTLLALSVSNTINFGAMSLGDTSTDSTENVTSVENTGNTGIDIQLSGDAMSCTPGSITASNIKYSTVDNTAYSSMTALSGTATTLDINISQRTDSTTSKNTFWKIDIPTTGVGGSCSSTITFTAISG